MGVAIFLECAFVVRPKGIEPLPQAPEAYVLSIGPRAHDFDATNEVYRDEEGNATNGEWCVNWWGTNRTADSLFVHGVVVFGRLVHFTR